MLGDGSGGESIYGGLFKGMLTGILGRTQGLRNNVLGGYVPVITEIVILPLPPSLSLSPR